MANDELNQVVEDIVRAFEQRRVQYALIGGLAVSIRGRLRLTKDADFIVNSPALEFPGLLEDLVAVGFQIDVMDTVRRWPVEHFTVFYRGDERVDWMQPIVPLYGNVLKSAQARPWGDQGNLVNVATAEGLILTKMLAFRPPDQLDIYTLLTTNADSIDLKQIREEWAPYTNEYPDRTAWLEGMIVKHVPAR
jgi:hypothetical protein